MMMYLNRQFQGMDTQQKERIDPFNLEVNYQEQQFAYDFDPEDRPCVYPNDSFAKFLYPENKNFKHFYGGEQSAGGQAFDADWSNVACTNYLGQCENKHRKPLYQVKWMKDGKKVVSSSSQG